MLNKAALDKATICVIGLGYVGLPLARAFSRHLKVVGLDIDRERLNKLAGQNNGANLAFTADAARIAEADVVIICVPTPVTKSKEPDLSYIRDAARIAGRNMKPGSLVVLESTVYPGVTEETVKPILEHESGLQCGQGFSLAYAPERINPSDEEHSLEAVTKVVAGADEETCRLAAELYSRIAPHIYRAKNIKTAEAAKAIENIQRDLNIALTNELALIFDKMGIATGDVLDAAATKWNFHRYSPGLVGGHCIPVDPYYLVYRSRELGYHPQVILAGRAINDSMPKYVAEMTVKALNEVGKVIKGSRVLIMGLTYKEDVADTRESPAKGIIKELADYGVDIAGYDPQLEDASEFGIRTVSGLDGIRADAVILTVAHTAFRDIGLDRLKKIMNDRPVLIDVRGLFDEKEAAGQGFHYRTL